MLSDKDLFSYILYPRVFPFLSFFFYSELYSMDIFFLDRYTRDNVLASERVGRSYIAAIPDFLKNRPAPFIQHCMTKIDFAETVEETDIIQLSTNCFKVHI